MEQRSTKKPLYHPALPRFANNLIRRFCASLAVLEACDYGLERFDRVASMLASWIGESGLPEGFNS
ncbi:MAG: hypothetical protein VYA59_01780 [Pseudomonadota bacterium]|jgi:hypothetical protein|nr:hypothetical protein [Pseudomonadota bacterium]